MNALEIENDANALRRQVVEVQNVLEWVGIPTIRNGVYQSEAKRIEWLAELLRDAHSLRHRKIFRYPSDPKCCLDVIEWRCGSCRATVEHTLFCHLTGISAL